MARIRTIKPEFWTDEKVMEVSPLARLLFIGLWNFADDNGNLEFSPKQIKAKIFPADSLSTHDLLTELITHGLLIEYSVNGTKYLNISGFLKHQVINRRSKTCFPTPPTHGALTEDSRPEGKGREGKVLEALPGVSNTSEPAELVSAPPAEAKPEPNPEPNPGPTSPPASESLGDNPDGSLGGDRLQASPPAAILARVCVANGIRATPFHPLLVEWARDGVTEARLKQAIATARMRKGDANIPLAYLDPIVSDEAKPVPQDWKSDDRKAAALCRELGIPDAKRGEMPQAFHARIQQALAARARGLVK